MKLQKPRATRQCSAIVTPGEYIITRWDGQQCHETNPQLLVHCEYCDRDYCLMMHWHKHMDVCP